IKPARQITGYGKGHAMPSRYRTPHRPSRASTPWLLWSIVLYVIAIACRLPVVALQIRLWDLAQQAARDRTELPARYCRCFKMWVALGFPAFFAFVAIFYLMVA